MFSTTTCTYTVPLQINNMGSLEPAFGSRTNFQFQNSICVTSFSTPSASNTPLFYNGISYGNLLTASFIFLILIAIFTKFLLDRLIGVKQQKPFKKYLGNNSQDGKDIIEY